MALPSMIPKRRIHDIQTTVSRELSMTPSRRLARALRSSTCAHISWTRGPHQTSAQGATRSINSTQNVTTRCATLATRVGNTHRGEARGTASHTPNPEVWCERTIQEPLLITRRNTMPAKAARVSFPICSTSTGSSWCEHTLSWTSSPKLAPLTHVCT